MDYFKVGVNPSSKKWRGYLNPDTVLYDESGVAVSSIRLSGRKEKINEVLFYKTLVDGEIPPVNSIGAEFVVFDEGLKGIGELSGSDIQLVDLKNLLSEHHYLLMNVYKFLDCVDWGESEYESWPTNYIPESWEFQKGRFFIKPVLNRKKIPRDIDAFRLVEWGGAFNIVVSERIRDRLITMDFDHSFLEFRALSLS
jgi:hypothetical protein